MARSLLLALALLATLPAAAQPTGRAVLDAWARQWQRAAADVVAIEAEESLYRTVTGPRGTVDVASDAVVRYGRSGPPERDAVRMTVNGRRVDADREGWHERRTRRAFGPGGRETLAPPPLASALAERAEPVGIAFDRVDGEPAWRLALDVDGLPDRVTAWFSRERTPRLLRLHAEGHRPGGRFERTIDFARIDGLDLAVASDTRLTVRQRRRLREYVVTLSAEGRYGSYRIARR